MTNDGSISRQLSRVRERIDRACARSGRHPDSVTLIGVTKTFPPEIVERAAQAGLLDFGENRVQELVSKAESVTGPGKPGVRWHMIGHLQRNKARDVVRFAHLFHSLDSARLARELDKWATRAERRLPCLLQVNTSGESSKEGLPPADVLLVLEDVAELPGLELRGLMTIAAPADDPEEVRHEFRALRELRDRMRAMHPRIPLDFLSMGMSGDFEVAIEEGATHVRVGRLLFGSRVG